MLRQQRDTVDLYDPRQTVSPSLSLFISSFPRCCLRAHLLKGGKRCVIQIKQRNEPSELCKPSYGSGLRGVTVTGSGKVWKYEWVEIVKIVLECLANEVCTSMISRIIIHHISPCKATMPSAAQHSGIEAMLQLTPCAQPVSVSHLFDRNSKPLSLEKTFGYIIITNDCQNSKHIIVITYVLRVSAFPCHCSFWVFKSKKTGLIFILSSNLRKP